MMTALRHKQHRGFGRKLGRGVLLSLLLALCSQPLSAAERITQGELNIALLYNVMKFVRWPDASFANAAQPVQVCAFSTPEYKAPLAALQTRKVGDRPIEVRKLSRGDDKLDECHAIFFADDDRLKYARELRLVAELPVLTVGDSRDFANTGGMVSLAKGRKRVNITINVTVSERAGLEFNSQLLELATVIRETQESEQ